MAEVNPIVRYRARPTRGNAIKAMCAHCMGCTDERLEPGFRSSIRDCASASCPLHKYRPYQRKEAS